MRPEQCRAARNLLTPAWSRDDLATKAGVSVMSVRRFEQSIGPVSETAVEKIQKALTRAGIVFLDPGERGPVGRAGVRLR